MSPRPDVSSERKLQILNAAEQAFSKKGFDETRMDDIAEETGLSKGTLYLYFKSKDDLIIAILGRIFEGVFKQPAAQGAHHVNACEEINQFTEEVVKDYKKMQHIMPVAYEFLALAFRNRTVQKAFKQYFRSFLEVMVPTIQRGIDSGEFRPVDAQEAAVAICAIYEGTVLLWVYDNNQVDIERHIHSSMKLLLEGLRAPA